jgi:hypothetical protein
MMVVDMKFEMMVVPQGPAVSQQLLRFFIEEATLEDVRSPGFVNLCRRSRPLNLEVLDPELHGHMLEWRS